MKEKIILILKGIIIGAGKIIPGVSGGMLAITLNIYDKGIKSISEFFKDIKNNFTFLFTLGIGILTSILTISKLIKYSLDTYYLPTMLLFIGLIIGGMPSIFKEINDKKSFENIIIMIIPFLIIFLLSITSTSGIKNQNISFIPLVLIGIVDAITMIIPGISGTAVLMMLGYYDTIINTFSSLTDFSLIAQNLNIIFPFGIGLVLGTIALTKIINYFLENHRTSSFYAIAGFAISSVLLLLVETFKNSYNISEVIISLLLMVLGYFISRKLEQI